MAGSPCPQMLPAAPAHAPSRASDGPISARAVYSATAGYDGRVDYDFQRIFASTTYMSVAIGIYVLYAIALWRVFSKAGYFGLLAFIPIVNIFIWVKIAGYSAWMTLLLLIPIVNIIFAIVVAVRIGRGFGKGGAWSFFLLWLIPIIGAFILGFGKARYRKPA